MSIKGVVHKTAFSYQPPLLAFMNLCQRSEWYYYQAQGELSNLGAIPQAADPDGSHEVAALGLLVKFRGVSELVKTGPSGVDFYPDRWVK